MPLFLLALVVVIVTALICWVINLLPFPAAPPYIKQILMAVIVLVAVIVIVARVPGVAW